MGSFFKEKGILTKFVTKKRNLQHHEHSKFGSTDNSTDHPLIVPMMAFADQMRGLGRPPHPSNQLASPNGCHYWCLPTVWDHPGRWEAHRGRASRHDVAGRSQRWWREDTVHCHSTGPGWADRHVRIDHHRPSQGLTNLQNASYFPAKLCVGNH